MEIRKAEFETSSPDYKKCPEHSLPEYAFIGRSNVGKSSLINMLTRKKGLAKTSATPGKTRLINYFKINESWYIVDLPGYGYAKLSHAAQEKLTTLIEGYVLKRTQLTCMMLLIDCRHAPMAVDLNFIHFLGRNGIPFAIIFTKLDKLSAKQWSERKEAYLKRLREDWEELPPIFATSSDKGIGREEILDFIEKVNTECNNTQESSII